MLALDLILIESIGFFLIWTYQLYLEVLQIPIIFFGFIASSLTIAQILFTNLAARLQKQKKDRKLLTRLYALIP